MDLFPYIPRRFQAEIVKEIEKAVERGENFCLHAPTGFGKTPVVLSAILPFGMPIVWISRTGNQVNRPIEELKVINERSGTDYFGISFRGKRDMCPVAREKNVIDYEAIGRLCKKCEYAKRFKTVPRQTMSFAEIYRLAKSVGVCPYRLQLEMAKRADLIAMSYNYVLSDLIFMLHKFFRLKNAILVVDEAHNLQKIASDINSDKLTKNSIARAAKEAKEYGSDRSILLARKIRNLLEYLSSIKDETLFSPFEVLKRAGITEEDLEYGIYIGGKIYEKQIAEGKPVRSYVRRFSRFWQRALEAEDEEGIALLQSSEGFEIFDMRSAEILSKIWEGFHANVFISGTLKPIDAFAETIGLKNYVKASVPSFASHVDAFIIRGVSTKGEELNEVQKEKYRFLIHSFLAYPGNVAIFTASYRVQEELMKAIREGAENTNRSLFVENEKMRGDEASKVLEEFKESERGLLVGPCGGRFAEGADFPGRSLEAIMLIGIPFDRVTLKTRLYIDYFTKKYGEKGKEYAYIIPALRRASQALGRAIRSPQDYGFFVLADERYKLRRYFELLPDYVQRNARMLHYSNFPMLISNFFQ